MAETRKKSTTTKTKTVPAKKPATKPAGKSVAPKATKTVKAAAKKTAKPAVAKAPATKTAKTTKIAKTTKPAKATKTASANSASAKASVKKHCKICKIIFAVIVAVAVVAVATWAIACVISKNADETVTVENGKGDKVSLKYASLEGYDYRVLVPTSFKELSAEEIKEAYGSSNAPELVYASADGNVNVAFSAPNNSLANDQIKEYTNAMKIVFGTSMNVLGTNTYEADGHTVGTIKLVSDFDGEEYNHMAFFSYDGKLAIIAFNCRGEDRAEWEKVGDEIIKSINFTK